MRYLAVALLAACGGPGRSASPSAVAAPPAPSAEAAPTTEAAPPPVEAAAAPAPALPTFARAGELFILTAEHGPRCDAWTIDPAAGTLASTATVGPKTIERTIDYRVEGTTLLLEGTAHRELIGGEVEDEETSTACGEQSMSEAEDALVLASGARWFRSRAACDAAIASHARVATELCMPLEIGTAEYTPHEPTRRRFHRLLARGGTLYSVVDGPRGDVCKAVRVRPERSLLGPRVLEGSFRWRVVRDDGVKGWGSAGYRLDLDAELGPEDDGYRHGPMTLLGGGATFADGSGYGVGCADFATPVYREDVVEVDAPMYLTAKACKAAIARDAEAARWLPPLPSEDAPADDVAAAVEGQPGLGC